MNFQLIIHTCYFAAAFLFIYGLKRMSSPVTARSGIVVAGYGMLIATLLPRLGLGAAAVSAAVWLGCVIVAEGVLGPRLVPFARLVTSLPLTVFALALFARLPRIAGLTPALVWLGQSSYGLYLGQLLTHNAFVFGVAGPTCTSGSTWLYTLISRAACSSSPLGRGLPRRRYVRRLSPSSRRPERRRASATSLQLARQMDLGGGRVSSERPTCS
jgi:peptidoglycan/LPS O-acetylase OafA/YrhL